MPQITYTDEFKCDAVALVASGIPQKQVAKDMGMAKTGQVPWSGVAGVPSFRR